MGSHGFFIIVSALVGKIGFAAAAKVADPPAVVFGDQVLGEQSGCRVVFQYNMWKMRVGNSDLNDRAVAFRLKF